MSRTLTDAGLATDLEIMDSYLSVAGRFLIDAGCGNMHISRELAARGASVLAIDPDPVQAEKNRQTETIANVGFAETGAQNIPVESQSVDGVLFPYSLHHVPQALYEAVFTEVMRVLKPDGFVYVLEPVAAGDLNEVMRLFHDEHIVREQAREALETHAIPQFDQTTEIEYRTVVQYDSWDEFANDYAAKSYNTAYSEADVRADIVRDRFMALGEPSGYRFESPKRVTFMQRGLIA